MALEPGPMQVLRNYFSTKEEVLDEIKTLDLWPTTYVSERMEELPLHWHDVDNHGYILEGKSYLLDENGEQVPIGPGDKLVIPAGALHAEGQVTEKMVYIVGINKAANLFEALTMHDPESRPTGLETG
jgi:quercetin dioxygenase-like cupin family protein